MNAKKQEPMKGSTSCGPVVIRWETEPSESPEGPGIGFWIDNNGPHTIASKFGYKVTSTLGAVYQVGFAKAIGTGRLNSRRKQRFGPTSGMFPNSIDPKGDHPQILSVVIGPIWVAQNIDVDPPHMPAGSYIDTWRDYPDLITCPLR